MELSPTRKKRLAAVGAVLSVSFLAYMLSGSGPVGPPYRDENLTAGPEPLMLLRQPSVTKELKLTEAQVRKIREAVEQQSGRRPRKDRGAVPVRRVARMGRNHQEAFLAGVLRPEQAARLRQIILQLQGGFALTNARTATELGLTESQRKSADAILERFTRRLEQSRAGRGREGRKQAEEVRAAFGKELLGLLTPEQEKRWKELTGEPFTGEIRFGPPGGPPPRGRGPGAAPSPAR